MPALLKRALQRPAPEAASESERPDPVATVLANLEQSIGQRPTNVSYRKFRELAQERARASEQEFWGPVRFAARSRGDW